MDMPKFHCRRQSGMNFGYVTENGVNSNPAAIPRKWKKADKAGQNAYLNYL